MSQAICPSCGACTVDAIGRCVYCGTKREQMARVITSSGVSRSSLKADSNSPEFQKKELLKEISFLEDQYKETSHPSILIKLENAQMKLRTLK